MRAIHEPPEIITASLKILRTQIQSLATCLDHDHITAKSREDLIEGLQSIVREAEKMIGKLER